MLTLWFRVRVVKTVKNQLNYRTKAVKIMAIQCSEYRVLSDNTKKQSEYFPTIKNTHVHKILLVGRKLFSEVHSSQRQIILLGVVNYFFVFFVFLFMGQ